MDHSRPVLAANRRGWRAAAVAVFVIVVWSASAWHTWARTTNVKPHQQTHDDLAAYDSVRGDLAGIDQAWILIERPTARRALKRTNGQAQRAQYALAPTVITRITSPDVAAFHVRKTSDVTVILQFSVTEEHLESATALMGETARARDLKMSGRRVSENLYIHRFEKVP